jgi:ABC-type multidrug transport system fused ATPase/permease subunit
VANIPRFRATVRVRVELLQRLRAFWRYARIEREDTPADGWARVDVGFDGDLDAAFRFLPVAALIVLAYAAWTRLRRVREESRRATERMTGALGELFDAVQAVQVAGAEGRVVARVRRLGEERRRAALRDRLAALVLEATFENTANLGAGLTLVFAASALEHDLAAFPEGLDTEIGARGLRLSGGQQQRAAAARMLVREPELYVVDDPSSALDVETEALLWRRLLGLGGTYLVATHRREVLERADLILLLVDGRVAARGGLGDLLGRDAGFAAWSARGAAAGSR